MKIKTPLILVCFILFYTCSKEVQITDEDDSNIYYGDVSLTSQEEVNNFGDNNYLRITGSLSINDASNNIIDLSALNDLEVIEQSLFIQNCNNLISLNGLENISSISHSVRIADNIILENITLNISEQITTFSCFDNPSLLTLNLPNLITANFFEVFNLRINTLINIDSLTNIIEELTIAESFVTNLDSFLNLNSVPDQIRIYNNPNLENVDGFENINGTIHTILIDNNPALLNLNGLLGLTSVSLLEIKSNNALNNLDGLNGLTQITNGLIFYNNLTLTDLNGLNNVNSIGGSNISYINITSNPMLSNFCGISNVFINGSFNGNYLIELNHYNPTVQNLLNGNCN